MTQKRSRETDTKKGAAYGPHRCTPHARITATEATTMLPTTRMPKHSETTTACKRLRRRTTAAEDGQGPASKILSITLHYDSEPRAPCRRKEQHQHGLTTHGANAPMHATRRSPHTPEPACHGTENQANACNHGNGEQHSHGIHQLGRTTPYPNNILRTEMPSDDAARNTHLRATTCHQARRCIERNSTSALKAMGRLAPLLASTTALDPTPFRPWSGTTGSPQLSACNKASCSLSCHTLPGHDSESVGTQVRLQLGTACQHM